MIRKRKPDILSLLAILIGLGVLATGLSQGVMHDSQAQTVATTTTISQR